MSAEKPLWEKPPEAPALSSDEVHVWRAAVTSVIPELHDTLSDDECARADRFRFEKDRTQYAKTRGVLRTLLGEYLGCAW